MFYRSFKIFKFDSNGFIVVLFLNLNNHQHIFEEVLNEMSLINRNFKRSTIFIAWKKRESQPKPMVRGTCG